MKSVIVITSVAAVALICACASAPKRSEQLEQARAEVETLAQDPMAATAAGQELQAARSSLQAADTALSDKRPIEEVNHLAYLAERNAELGKTRIQEARSRKQIAEGEAERNRVLLEARTAEAQRAQATAQSAQQEAMAARQELESLQAQQTNRGMVITLGDVLFDTGAASLKAGAAERIDRLSAFLNENPNTRILIEGHTDSRGSDAYNEELSRRRAQAVADALATRGIPASRFEIIGRGEAVPVASNDSPSGRQQNRRVEIVFSDESGRFAQGARTSVLR